MTRFGFGEKIIQLTDLRVPSIGKESKVGAIEKNIEG